MRPDQFPRVADRALETKTALGHVQQKAAIEDAVLAAFPDAFETPDGRFYAVGAAARAEGVALVTEPHVGTEGITALLPYARLVAGSAVVRVFDPGFLVKDGAGEIIEAFVRGDAAGGRSLLEYTRRLGHKPAG